MTKQDATHRITMTAPFDPYVWADTQTLDRMSNQEIMELCQEDMTSLLEDVTGWTVERRCRTCNEWFVRQFKLQVYCPNCVTLLGHVKGEATDDRTA